MAVQRYDAQTGAAYLDPLLLETELGASLGELAADVDALESGGYLERANADETGEGVSEQPESAEATTEKSWALRPTDKGLMSAMGF